MIDKFNKFDEKNEGHDTEHYMFFANLETIKRLADKMLSMDKNELDQMLKEHDWANDHISTSKDDIEEVFNFIASTEIYKNDSEESEYDIEIKPENIVTDENRKKEIEDSIWKDTIFDKSKVQNFNNFNK